FPNAGRSGFSFQIDTTKLNNGEHILAVRLLDAAGNATVIGSRTIVVENQVFTVLNTDIPRGRKGDPYSAQLTAVNGKPPYSWSLLSGSLPTGLSLNVAGLISGTPGVAGNFPITVRVTDSVGA